MRCPVCQSEKPKILKGYEKDFLCKCLNCSLIYSNKKPTSQELEDTYSKYNYLDNKHPEATIKKVSNISKRVFSLNKPVNVLDIGCGDGLYLDQFKSFGCKTYATEFNERLTKIAEEKGHEIVGLGLYPELKKDLLVDTIIFTEIIEHINEQVKCLNHFKKLLSKNGIIFITTPNFSALERRLFKKDWEYLCYPEHLCYFSTKTLNKTMERCGFRKLFSYTEGISMAAIIIYLQRKGYNNNDNNLERKSQIIQELASERPILRYLKNQTNFFLNATRLGTKIVAAYAKNN